MNPTAVNQTAVSPLGRRRLLQTGAALCAASPVAGLWATNALAAPASVPVTSAVFAHGVASGDPLPDRVILWTRITATVDAVPGSGRGAGGTVRWEIAHDEHFGTIVASGAVDAVTEHDFTVKVDAAGLTPATEYHYRFRVTSGPATGAVSPVGRTRTA
ncbi:MAG TPA: alkaline phosphatase, partial [Gordonia polyisoprenivorans]|nr:alkaline phosphatase [Gordonia polyisoprenivorans]